MRTDAAALLRASEWRPERRSQAHDAVADYHDHGYDIGPELAAVVSNVAGIVLRFERGGRADSIVFDPELALRLSYADWVAEYSRRAGSSLIPIGFSSHEHLLLLVDAKGRWFGAFDDEFGRLGSSVVDMVDRIVNNLGLEEND